MAWDIYGNTLTPGYCEVHPWIHEEYPCHLCELMDEEYQEQRRQDDLIRAHHEEQIREYQQDQELEFVVSCNVMINKIVNKID